MKKTILSAISLLLFVAMSLNVQAQALRDVTTYTSGDLVVKPVAKNAVRIQYIPKGKKKNLVSQLPDWLYVKHDEVKNCDVTVENDTVNRILRIKDKRGKVVFTATKHMLKRFNSSTYSQNPGFYEATLTFDSPKDEYLYGLGQFQDGYSNVRGLSRRLTQVNTQISIPMLISSKGYGILWNNYGLTDFNPCDYRGWPLNKQEATGTSEVVNVTTTEGGRREVRQRNIYTVDFTANETGDYRIMLDVGQKMARRHNLAIDGKTVIEMQNMWLPPTASAIVHLEKGSHHVTAELTRGDEPKFSYGLVRDETTFRSPLAEAVDYTVFVGTPDEIIASYRELTGQCPPMPEWALGYIHCRERFHSSEEILQTANRFKKEEMPKGPYRQPPQDGHPTDGERVVEDRQELHRRSSDGEGQLLYPQYRLDRFLQSRRCCSLLEELQRATGALRHRCLVAGCDRA